MNVLDRLTQRLRERFTGRRQTDHEEAEKPNRAKLRSVGVQGARGGIAFQDGQIIGKPIGSFLGRTPAISNVSNSQRRTIEKLARMVAGEPVRPRGRTRAKRAAQRAVAP